MTAIASSHQVGRSVDRVEGRDKVTGRALYTADHDVEGLLYAVLVQSQIPQGVITAESLTTSTARASAAPGVSLVLTPLNCPALGEPPRDMSFDLPLERRPPLSDLSVQQRRATRRPRRRRHPGERGLRGVVVRPHLRAWRPSNVRRAGPARAHTRRRPGRAGPAWRLPTRSLRQTDRGEAAGSPWPGRRTARRHACRRALHHSCQQPLPD